jgi:hypothetical protein
MTRDSVSASLIGFGILLLFGGIMATVIGLDNVTALYERIRPFQFIILGGVILLVVGGFLASGQKPAAAAPDKPKPPTAVPPTPESAPERGIGDILLDLVTSTPEGAARCGKCGANNDAKARFCNQCGSAF